MAYIKMYRIAWRLWNGYEGNGEFCFTEKEAYSSVEFLNKEFPEISHWVEKMNDYV